MKTPITPEALIEMGFVDTSYLEDGVFNDYTYTDEKFSINFYGNNILEIQFFDEWITTNAKTMEDIQDLIRLFK
jgi:hypothetical protein